MVLGASFEFDKANNSEIMERPSDNEEVPTVGAEPVTIPVACVYPHRIFVVSITFCKDFSHDSDIDRL